MSSEDKHEQEAETVKVEWSSFSLPHFKELEQGLAAMNWTFPLPVQVQTLPLIFNSPHRRNLIAQAPTGKGKTGAFAIGMLCQCDPGLEQPQSICLSPAREIAIQTADKTLSVLAPFIGLKVFKAIRDFEVKEPIKEQAIVGTPGTVLKLIKEGKLRVDKIRVLVIDEADTMVQKDMEKRSGPSDKKTRDMTRTVLDIKNAIEKANGGDLQNLLFSATFDDKALTYARKIAPNAEEFLTESQDDQHPVDNVQQYVFHCNSPSEKFQVLERFLRFMTIGSCIIFTNTKVDADVVCEWLKNQGFSVRVTHGGKDGNERDTVMDDFRQNKFNFLVATNVVGRGLDVPQVNFVVNFDLPRRFDRSPDPREFIHRVGRAGRVDRKGVAICFTDNQFDFKKDIKFLFDTYKQKVNFAELDASNEDQHMKEIFKLQEE